MIRFIHTADIHFGMENYGKIDATTGIHTRLLDFHRSLNMCIDRAIEERVDFFLFSGDAYKTAHPSPTQQRLLMHCFLRLFRAQIPIVMVIGNHDNALSFGKAHALEIFGQIPIDGFHVIAQPKTITLATKHGPIAIVGIPWPSRTTIALQGPHVYASGATLAEQISNAVSDLISELAAQIDPAMPAVLAAHVTVSSGIFSGSEKRAIYGTDPVLLPSQLAIPPFDYVALGHLHRYQNLNTKSYPAVVYSGSIDRIDFGERSEEKGFCLVTIPAKGACTHEFIPLPVRPFIQIEVVLEEDIAYTEQIISAIKRHTIQDAIVKILYHVPPGARERIDTTAIQQACTPAHHVVGIIPIRKATALQPRMARITPDMGTLHLIESYLNTKPELAAHKQRLIERATALLADYERAKRA